MCRRVMAELEALGFRLEPDVNGSRAIHPQLAEAVRIARSQKKELAALRVDPAMAQFLTPGAATDTLDPLDVLIFIAAEVSILRETVGIMTYAMSVGIVQLAQRPGVFGWSNSALPDPRHSL